MSTKVGPYRLSRTLGIGAFSKVKMAIHEPTKKKVAIKILNRKKLSHMDMGHKIWREINILRMFNHLHINRLYEVIDTPTDIFVVVEYVPGGELFDFIVSKGRLSEPDARTFFQQVISGVSYCHKRMVVHRDLKPENILLDDQNNIKIADFGLSNIMKDGFFLKTSCGSPNYAAPEVISGNLYGGPEVDVWSCGVILYALLCGSLPFDDENIPNLFRKIKSGTYSIPHYLSPSAKDLIPKMLEVDPIARITIDEIKRHPFFTKNLPIYLSMEEELDAEIPPADEEIVEVLLKMKEYDCTREDILKALEGGPELLTNWDFPDRPKLRPLAVTYHILLDEKKKREKNRLSQTSIKSEPVKPFFPDAELNLQKIGLGMRLPPSRRINWAVGLPSKKLPSTVMNTLLECLKSLGVSWKLITPYKIKIRFVQRYYSIDDTKPNVKIIKAILQLYEHFNRNLNTHILDFQNLDGDAFAFMQMASTILLKVRLEL